MDVRESFKKFSKSYDYKLDILNSLNRVSQKLICHAIDSGYYKEVDLCGVICEELLKMTPIEQIFYIAFYLYHNCFYRKESNLFMFDLIQQEKIILSKTYIVDFIVQVTNFSDMDRDYKNEVIIECDGHDYHKLTKQQVAKDNERDMDLKLNGFEVIRFSGSQIYNDPFGCAEQLYKYLYKKYGVAEYGGS